MRLTPLALAIALVPVVLVAQAPAVDRDGEADMLGRINALRAEAGAPPLTRHDGLDDAARVHSLDLASHGQLIHVSPRTGDPNARARAAGVSSLRITQNIARHATTSGALESIVSSAPHRAQLLDSGFTHVGLASVAGAEGMYVTQVLAQLAPPPAELPPPAVSERLPRSEVELRTSPATPPATPLAPEVELRTSPATPSATPLAPEVELRTSPATPSATPLTPDVAQAPTALPVPRVPPPAVAPAPAPQAQAPLMRVPSTHRRVAGYWIQHGGRWWFFPVPATAQPGQLLQPDLTVQGPPPGYRRPRASPTRAMAPPPPMRFPAGQAAPRAAPSSTIRWY